jgi:gamma-glutamyltranspeptidase/glutathione hydrolase
MTKEDLLLHESVLSEPISVDYDMYRLFEHGPNGQGIVALMVLQMLKEMEKHGRISSIKDLKHNSADYIHTLVELLKLSFADGKWFVTDPEKMIVKEKDLLDPEYLNERAKLFDPSIAMPMPEHGIPMACDTVYFCCVDEQGNACSVVNSLYTGFGSLTNVPGYGIMLQSRGSNFSLKKDSPNVYAGSKRPYHTIIPAMVLYKDSLELFMAFGVMGGFNQPQAHLQVFFNVILFGMSVQEALDKSRFCIDTNTGVIEVDEDLDEKVVQDLQSRGHTMKIAKGIGRVVFGRGQIIKSTIMDGIKILAGGSDPRADGCAGAQI